MSKNVLSSLLDGSYNINKLNSIQTLKAEAEALGIDVTSPDPFNIVYYIGDENYNHSKWNNKTIRARAEDICNAFGKDINLIQITMVTKPI